MEKNTKLMAAVGSLLLVLVLLPGIHWISIVGIVLFLVAIHTLSKSKNEPTLFQEALWAFLIPTIGGFVLAILGGIGLTSLIVRFAPSIKSFHIENIQTTLPFADILTALGTKGVILGIILLGVYWILAIAYGIKMQKVSLILEKHLGNSNFRTAGTLFFWGGWLSPLVVGVLLIWVGWLFYTIAFFSLTGE